MIRTFLSCSLLALACGPLASAQEKAKITPLPVNTPGDEDEPHLADAGLTLYFTANPKEGKDDLMIATRSRIGGPWTKAEILQDYIQTRGNDRGCYALGGTYPHYLFYATTKDPSQKNFDLYVAVKQERGRAWSAPTPVMNVNTRADEAHPWVSADGKTLYFSRKTAKGWVQMKSTRGANKGPGGWGEPEEVGLPVGFYHATFMPSGKTAFVQGPGEKGRSALYLTRLEADGWTKPELIDSLEEDTGKKGNCSPSLSRDGKYLLFASDRDGGKGGLDLYYVATAELLSNK
jgi:hypothetical protein